MSDSGPALILAGPGSGKTTVLTHHIKHLTDSGVSPDKILVITFTKKAAHEMRSRFESLSPSSVHQTVFGTFHSVFFRIIKAFDKREIRLVSAENRNNFLLTFTGDLASAEYYGNRISFYKSLYDKTQYRFAGEAEKEEFLHVYKEYNRWLSSEEIIDYDDIIEECYVLLKNNHKAVSYLNNKFSHILVDEFQDINSIQYETLKIIAGKAGIIYAVGDEDQSIYGFRGATPDIMKQFVNDYKNVTVINLNKNYRSFGDISDFSQKIIEQNPGRIRTDKIMSIKNDGFSHVHLKVFKSRNEEVADCISDIAAVAGTDKTVACLLRTNKEVDEFKQILNDDCRDENVFKASVIDEFITVINYCLNKDSNSLKAIISKLIPGIPTTILSDCDGMESVKRKLKGTAKGDKISVFDKKLNVLKNLNPFSFTVYLKNVFGLYEFHASKCAADNIDILSDTYDEILQVSKNSKELADFKNELLKIKPKTENTRINKSPILTITTFHQAKGLEFDRVFIPDVTEGKIPAGMAVADCKVEEERRLFYVALTRAKEELFVYTIKNEESGGALPSRFINEFIY